MIVDTDVIIRYFTNDDQQKADRFRAFLTSGKKATLMDVTFAEIYWTLTSFYKMGKKSVLSHLLALIESPALNTNESVLRDTIALLQEYNMSFIDAYTAVSAKNLDAIVLSFDRGFDKISGIKRIEP